MRSFDRSMPEELNRVLSDHASSLLLAPPRRPSRTFIGACCRRIVVGDVWSMSHRRSSRGRMRGWIWSGPTASSRALPPDDGPPGGNVDEPARLRQLVSLLLGLDRPVVLPLHPRTRARLTDAGLLETLERADRIHLSAPLGYLELAALMCNAAAVLTDSGGLQKEAYLAGVRCVTMRPSTEWVETVELGWNVLVDLDEGAAREALAALDGPPPTERPPVYGDGHAGERVVRALQQAFAG